MEKMVKTQRQFQKLQMYVFSLIITLTFLALIQPINGANASELKMEMAPINPAFLNIIKQPNQPLNVLGKQDLNTYHLGYIPSPLLLPIDQKVVKKLNSTDLLTTSFPTSYDLRTKNKLTAVRDQSTSGSCWAFATMGSLESVLMPGEKLDFSENNLKNRSGFDAGPNDGGNETMSIAYLSRWEGPVSEADDPYNPNSTTSPLKKPQKHIQETLRFGYTDQSYNDIKNALIEYGAVQTSIYMNNGYFNSIKNSYYCNNFNSTPNHAVDIVGWDDNYSKENFLSKPETNGAFIVRNSWGSSWGDKGYFYVSYWDAWTGVRNTVFNNAEKTSNFNTVYQYDPLGYVNALGCGSNIAWMANAFNATSSQPLSAISFYTPVPDSTYEICVYNNFDGNFSAMEPIKVGTIDMAGYHTINLGKNIPVKTGERFAVSVKLTTPNYDYPIPLEYPLENFSSKATASAGQSYVSEDGLNWDDLTDFFPNSNVCIKAFTKEAAPLKSLTIDPLSLNLSTGQSKNLTLTATYTDNTTENVTDAANWKSSDVKIATVDSKGMVTAVAKGTATITASFGGKTLSIKVKVTPVVVGLQANPDKVSLLVGKVQAVKVSVLYEDGTKEDVSKSIQWETADDQVAIITSTGIKGIGKGETKLIGKYNDELSVEVPVKATLPVKSLIAAPNTLNIVINDNQTIDLSAVYTDDTTENVTDAANWKSSNVKIATVDSKGMVTAVAKGTATITASFGGKTLSIKVVVGLQ